MTGGRWQPAGDRWQVAGCKWQVSGGRWQGPNCLGVYRPPVDNRGSTEQEEEYEPTAFYVLIYDSNLSRFWNFCIVSLLFWLKFDLCVLNAQKYMTCK